MDFHFRQYDPQIGRFLGVDPLADMYNQEKNSPYAAMGNNPISNVDPFGLAAKVNPAIIDLLDGWLGAGNYTIDGDVVTIKRGKEWETFEHVFKMLAAFEGSSGASIEAVGQMAVQVIQMLTGSSIKGEIVLNEAGGLDFNPAMAVYLSEVEVVEEKVNNSWVRTVADAMSGNQVSKMEYSLFLLETEGYKSYLYSQVGNARSDIMFSMLGQYRGGKGGKVAAKRIPKPAPKFKAPTNPPQLPPSTVPEGMIVRVMRPTQQYPNGYWRFEKPMPQGGAQGINPTTMKPGAQHETHVPLPSGYWK